MLGVLLSIELRLAIDDGHLGHDLGIVGAVHLAEHGLDVLLLLGRRDVGLGVEVLSEEGYADGHLLVLEDGHASVEVVLLGLDAVDYGHWGGLDDVDGLDVVDVVLDQLLLVLHVHAYVHDRPVVLRAGLALHVLAACSLQGLLCLIANSEPIEGRCGLYYSLLLATDQPRWPDYRLLLYLAHVELLAAHSE